MNNIKQLQWKVDDSACNREGMELTSYQPLMGVVAEYRIVPSGHDWECSCTWDKEMFWVGSMFGCQLKCNHHMDLTLTNAFSNNTYENTTSVAVLNLKLKWEVDPDSYNIEEVELISTQPPLSGSSISVYRISVYNGKHSCRINNTFISEGVSLDACKSICKKHLERFIEKLIKHNS